MITRSLLCLMLLTAATGAMAHHSFAMFDAAHRSSIQGTVRAVEWTNPHVWVWIDHKEGSGAPVPYAFELASPGEITRNSGWKKTSLTIGEQVTIEYAALRSGKNGGALARVIRSNGEVLYGTAEHLLPPKPGEKPKGAPPGANNVGKGQWERDARANS
jgi:hypothetical protein